MTDKVNAAVDLIEAAWVGGDSLSLPPSLLPVDMDEATLMQDVLARRLGRKSVGWKLGLTSASGQRAQGIGRPFTGRLFDGTVVSSPARFAADEFLLPLVEAEFAFRFGRALPARAAAYGADEVLDAVETAFIGIEVADTRWQGSWPFPIPLLCADNGATGAYVVGQDIPGWRDLDFSRVETTLAFNGQRVANTLVGDDRPDMVGVLVWAANDLSRRGIGLFAGDIVTTGSACTPTAIPPGTRAVASFDGIGEVVVELAARVAGQ